MRLFLILLSQCFTFLIHVTKGLNYCEIQFPKPDVTLSTNFDLFTNNGKENLNTIGSYIPEKTYDITVSLKDTFKDDHSTIKEIYVYTNEVSGEDEELEDINWKNGGEVIFNVTHASKTEYCTQRASVQYIYTQPQHITFYWKAPKKTDLCIRITVILNIINIHSESSIESKYYITCDQTKKNKDEMQGDQPEIQNCEQKKKPPSVARCNILSTAVYRMTIENRWNSLNHWRDWPGKDGYIPKLTQYLGASHTNDFNLYHIGGIASQGVLEVCSNGSYNLLQQQFYKAGNGIMAVILARSLDASSKINKRSALIVVNASSHLVSFISRLIPSPDWCTGLSRYDLCGGNCKWPEKVSVPLYPWDAGIYSGETYLVKKDMQFQSPICPITSSWPKDNPFTVIDGVIQNIGMVTFTLIQEYNKSPNPNCNYDKPIQDEAYSNTNERSQKSPQFSFLKSNVDKTRHCPMTQWSQWSLCSKVCGKGEKVRYRKSIKENIGKCIEAHLKEVETCNQKCPTKTSMETCSLRLWSPWSPCNATCSQPGQMFRERVFINEQEKQECAIYSGMKDHGTCRLASDRCNSDIVCNEYVNVGDLCIWYNPSQRYFYDFSTGNCNSFQYRGCFGGLNNFHTYKECIASCNPKSQQIYQSQAKTPMTIANRCDVPMTWGVMCEHEQPSTRWSFDKIHRKCFKFHFNGCRGNANNFQEKIECEKVCLTKEILITNPVEQLTTEKITIKTEKTTTEKPSCIYSRWSEWSSCDSDCQKTESRSQSLLIKNENCNDEIKESRKCQLEICSIPKPEINKGRKCKYTDWSSWTSCSSQCGQGVRERKRKKLSYNCIPEYPQFTERESCYNACAFY